MSFVPPDFGRPRNGEKTGTAAPGRAEMPDSLERRWLAVSRAAAAVAALAPEAGDAGAVLAMPDALRNVAGIRRRLVEESLDDIVAVMEPGLTALLALHRVGTDTAVPARALWREYLSAREGLLALAGAGGGIGHGEGGHGEGEQGEG